MTIKTDDKMHFPPSWSDDELSSFLGTAHQNVHVTFHQQKFWYEALRTADDCFMKIANNLLNPQNQIAPLFFFRSHSAYRAACGTAMSGQVVESFALARVCIEYAGYALYLHTNTSSIPIWFEKANGNSQRKAFRQTFTQTNVRGCIESYDRRLAEVYEELYQRAIDTGAHPNELAVSGSMTIVDDPDSDRVHIKQSYLQDDKIALEYGLKSTVQTGLCSLHLFQWIFKERFSLLGVKDTIEALRKTRGL